MFVFRKGERTRFPRRDFRETENFLCIAPRISASLLVVIRWSSGRSRTKEYFCMETIIPHQLEGLPTKMSRMVRFSIISSDSPPRTCNVDVAARTAEEARFHSLIRHLAPILANFCARENGKAVRREGEEAERERE